MKSRNTLGLLILATVGLPCAVSASCFDEGIAAYKSQGPEEAVRVFRAALETPDCANDPMALLNLARALESISKTSGLTSDTCHPAEIFLLVQNHDRAPAPLRTLAQKSATKLLDACASLTEEERAAAFTATLTGARQATKRRAIYEARRRYATAIRLRPQALEPHRSLCKLLKASDPMTAASHCEAWRTLASEQPIGTVETTGQDIPRRTLIWTGVGAVSMGAGLIAYMLADQASDDAFAANLRARTAAQDRDIAKYQAATEAQENAVSKLQSLQTTSWILFGVGVAGCAVATYYWLDDSQVEFGLGPSHVTFKANF